MNIDWGNILVGGIVGALFGFLLVRVCDCSRKATLCFIGFKKESVSFGVLYKLRFIVKGYFDPGVACIKIGSKGYSTFAKWDEMPNPLKGDNLSDFIPEMVPSTYFQPIFLNTEYCVPVIIEESNNGNKRFVFDGWWFGKGKGYYHGQELREGEELTLNVLGGNGLNWIKPIKVKNIISCS